MKDILVASFDMEVGGVERSLISMLEGFDYKKYAVDLMLYRHQGDFMELVCNKVNLLEEVPQYTTFRKSIGETLKDKEYGIGFSRILSKINTRFAGKAKGIVETGYYQMQLMWKYAIPFLPKLDKEYDVAISYLWPHYFVADKVKAKKKIAWIHTDYSTIETDVEMDLKVWNKFDYIVAVSEACKNSFLKKYSALKNKVIVMENITSPQFIRDMANEEIDTPMLLDNRFKVITVARLSHAKGIDNAVRALRILKDKGYENIAWYVVGYGGDETMIKNLIRDLKLENSFVLLGKQTNPYPYIKEADLYVQPSRYEGKAVTVGEAQILAKPVLITNYTTANSQVKNGIDGYITELSVEGIADGIEKLYRDATVRKQLANNCSNTDYSNTYELNKLYEIMET
ncbi:glycosyltransferase [Bacillus pseudomycoides]|uniref:Glycosyl transferase n=1 Tax=Bacillus pseudomycoides TaxID=64104 RepID=A0A2A8CAR0_9BACI|nr:glycosyltransferase [Bacillus pseudomycoides]PDY48176.1 glycosyl transferase [Bacillus pseudomycoides]PEA84110.1 glycosyl transferase [Bacillus pseudomycoides]PED07774.1 glycosyl transferase [Bacillus pseudomycoides]PED70998.1 glycosyl transferase [Bacillus pseudomycoides]PEI44360.1 glycosyl transferase [Bacillus pseudomycoides]